MLYDICFDSLVSGTINELTSLDCIISHFHFFKKGKSEERGKFDFDYSDYHFAFLTIVL